MTCEACSKNANHRSAWVVTAMFNLCIYLDMILVQAGPPRCLGLSRMRGFYPRPKPDLEIQRNASRNSWWCAFTLMPRKVVVTQTDFEV